MDKIIISLVVAFGFIFASCSDEPKDNVKEISMSVSSETGIMYDLFDSERENPIECMLVMSEDNPGVWSPLSFDGIKGFSYEFGHEYELRVKRTIFANPPQDASDRYYELVNIISDRLVDGSQLTVDENIKRESDIEYCEGCPISKYAISGRYAVDDNGNIKKGDESEVPSYASARIWLDNILDKADPDWVKYQKAKYQATYIYVISPLNDEIRLIRNGSDGPMFKDVIPENEFNFITQTMDAGDELKYGLILANVYKKGIQRLDLVISKTGEVADKHKFKLVQSGFTPFMNDNFSLPAPFDNISYQITDYLDRYQLFPFPEFTERYDSIVWCADGLPGTVKIYERQNSDASTQQHFKAHWSTHFYRGGEIENHLYGYRDGKVVYSASLTTCLRERDFLCYDWTKGSFSIFEPGNTGIFCLLDPEYEYTAEHTQEKNGTRYARIYVWHKSDVSDEDFPDYAKDSLLKLMSGNYGQGQSASGKADSFKCLPAEGIEAVAFWENTATRILLLCETSDENDGLEDYFLHFEAK